MNRCPACDRNECGCVRVETNDPGFVGFEDPTEDDGSPPDEYIDPEALKTRMAWDE